MRARLTLLVASTMVLILLAFLVPLAVLVRQAAEDRALSRAADVIQSIVPLAGAGEAAALQVTVTAQSVPVTVFLPDGTVLGAPSARTPGVRLAATRNAALTVTVDAGRELVVPVSGTAGTTVIRALVPASELSRGVTRAWTLLALLGLVLVLLGLFVADRLARTITAPISQLSAVSHRLASAELDARAEPAGPPELREVAGALNHLAGRIQDLLATERERVADLSHRLRTPLTALRLEAESLRDPEESSRVAAAADQVARAVTAVIQQTRRATVTPTTAVSCDATAVVADRVAFWAVLAEDTGRAVQQDLPSAPLPVAVAADDLAAALDALLGNVFAHTPDGTPFSVTLTPLTTGGASLTVADSGPGLPPESSRRGASGGGSTGLGLDIARRAAASFEISSPPTGGAMVRLRFAAG
ncbi:HAMP domain-containing protein [Actinoplanes couchii]|uniref:histidine kinase n=1 Tax=Actinoplanes couchii TaxID=403638 RepID=A0ABQ3X740_9ACTN|nr:HAMP domain-containing protein [Actinoplanes couchii]MDR6322139.1 signal transduction histidine kinase [Actinoplanes couchii]GID54304.1 two-component sensor histidine kinase [Actinoplanes couchii]